MGSLVARPLRRIRPARYPAKLEVLADPELLAQHQPAAWLSNREIAAAVRFVAGAGGDRADVRDAATT